MMTTENLAEIEGLISPAEAKALASLAPRLPRIAPTIVEIGSYTGKSATNMAAAAPNAMVYCIDLWDMHLPSENHKKRRRPKYRFDFNSTAAFNEFKRRTSEFSNIISIKGDSQEIAKAWSKPIGLLFIDGAHSFDAARADYENWGRWIAPGGWLVLHDALKGGPKRVIEEVIIPERMFLDFTYIERLAITSRLVFG